VSSQDKTAAIDPIEDLGKTERKRNIERSRRLLPKP